MRTEKYVQVRKNGSSFIVDLLMPFLQYFFTPWITHQPGRLLLLLNNLTFLVINLISELRPAEWFHWGDSILRRGVPGRRGPLIFLRELTSRFPWTLLRTSGLVSQLRSKKPDGADWLDGHQAVDTKLVSHERGAQNSRRNRPRQNECKKCGNEYTNSRWV